MLKKDIYLEMCTLFCIVQLKKRSFFIFRLPLSHSLFFSRMLAVNPVFAEEYKAEELTYRGVETFWADGHLPDQKMAKEEEDDNDERKKRRKRKKKKD